MKEHHTEVAEQVTVKTKEGGTRLVLDGVGKTPAKEIKVKEFKSSEKARLTDPQKKGFPEMERGGAVVVGKGKPGYPPGTEIPPTSVEVVRPLGEP